MNFILRYLGILLMFVGVAAAIITNNLAIGIAFPIGATLYYIGYVRKLTAVERKKSAEAAMRAKYPRTTRVTSLSGSRGSVGTTSSSRTDNSIPYYSDPAGSFYHSSSSYSSQSDDDSCRSSSSSYSSSSYDSGSSSSSDSGGSCGGSD